MVDRELIPSMTSQELWALLSFTSLLLHVLEHVDPPEGVAPPDLPQRLELALALGQVLLVHHVLRRLSTRLLRLGQVGPQVLKSFRLFYFRL